VRAFAVVGPGRGELLRSADPQAGVNQAVLRVISNGVCASDLPVWAGPQESYPIYLGHEPVAEVVAAGPGTDIPVGTLVTGRVAPSFADLVLADAADLVVVPEGLDPAYVLGEPLGCVAEAFRRTGVRLGDRAAVVGLGFMGLVMTQLLSRSPQSALVGVDPREDARLAALRAGADASFDPGDLPAGYTVNGADAAGTDGFDVVVEATGSPAGLSLAAAMVRPHGRLTILGYHQGDRVVDMGSWNWKAMDVVNGHVRDRALLRRSTEDGLRMLAAGRIDLSPLVTHVFSLRQVDEAFRTLRDKPRGFIKSTILVDPA
jgi:threonine dehydrogenase-like Zn-dependent dehydrogenase